MIKSGVITKETPCVCGSSDKEHDRQTCAKAQELKDAIGGTVKTAGYSIPSKD